MSQLLPAQPLVVGGAHAAPVFSPPSGTNGSGGGCTAALLRELVQYVLRGNWASGGNSHPLAGSGAVLAHNSGSSVGGGPGGGAGGGTGKD
jgi:hypothetical protein